MKTNLALTLDLTSLVAATALVLCACSRASSPAPASESAAKPPMTAAPPSEIGAAPPPPVAPASQSAAAPPPTAAPMPSPTPIPAPAASASPGADDCTRFDTSPEFRDLPPEDRARSRLTCEAKEELRAFVSTRQSCSTAVDCVYVTGSCPFGCTIPATKSAASDVTAKVAALGERLDKAGHRCVYRCMAPGAPACVAGKCAAGAR